MSKSLIYGVVLAVMIATGVATASQFGDVYPQGGASDSYTFPDGTVVRSAFVKGYTGQVVVVQIKQTSGATCYGMASGSSDGPYTSISCL